MKVEDVSLAKLKPYPGNPRRIDRAIEKVALSLREFGWRQPIVVDPDYVIVVGHVRFAAAQRLGLETVPVHVADDLTPAQAAAYRLMDNRANEEAEWDRDALAAELSRLEDDAEIALRLTGFDDSELTQFLTFELFSGKTEDDDAPDPQPKRVRSASGDLFLCGPHRVLCGDSRKREHLARLMDGKPAQLAFTDPPYNLAVSGKAGKIQNDDLSESEFAEFMRRTMRSLFACLVPGGSIYVCHPDDAKSLAFRHAFKGAGFHLAANLVWVKDRFTLSRGADFQWRHEAILYGWRPDASRRWYGGRAQSTVIEIARPKRSDIHPTMKPIELVALALENSSAEGDLVVDLFGGSGSTMIACHKLARVCRTMELDPVYCDALLARWQAYTGERPVRHDGVPFDEIELRECSLP